VPTIIFIAPLTEASTSRTMSYSWFRYRTGLRLPFTTYPRKDRCRNHHRLRLANFPCKSWTRPLLWCHYFVLRR